LWHSGAGTSGATFDEPAGVAVAADSTSVYVSERGGHRIRHVDADGRVLSLRLRFQASSQLF
jgi:hypothetical protein